MKPKTKKQIIWIIQTALIMTVGLILLKLIPMRIFGQEILFDASMHLTTLIFALYILYFFIDQNKNWRIPFFIIATGLLVVLSIQRIVAEKHDEIGLLLGLIISAIAIAIPRCKEIKNKLRF